MLIVKNLITTILLLKYNHITIKIIVMIISIKPYHDSKLTQKWKGKWTSLLSYFWCILDNFPTCTKTTLNSPRSFQGAHK